MDGTALMPSIAPAITTVAVASSDLQDFFR
jgi:hypothetical protein